MVVATTTTIDPFAASSSVKTRKNARPWRKTQTRAHERIDPRPSTTVFARTDDARRDFDTPTQPTRRLGDYTCRYTTATARVTTYGRSRRSTRPFTAARAGRGGRVFLVVCPGVGLKKFLFRGQKKKNYTPFVDSTVNVRRDLLGIHRKYGCLEPALSWKNSRYAPELRFSVMKTLQIVCAVPNHV